MNDLALRVMPPRVLSLLLLFCGFAFAGCAKADTLSLFNGDQLSGTLVSIGEQKVVFETTYLARSPLSKGRYDVCKPPVPTLCRRCRV